MREESLLEGKKILIVDDEPDVLDTLEDLLYICNISRASNFDEAKSFLEGKDFDFAILDIMGVAGFKLLEIANKRGVMAVMLTAHALNAENIVKSYREGAASYVPKDEMVNISNFLIDILEAKEKGINTWWRWLNRLGSFMRKRFGKDWQSRNKPFWKTLEISNKNSS